MESSSLAGGDEMANPALKRLLALGRVGVLNEPLPVVLCRDFGVQLQADWPLAALSWRGEGNEAGQAYWLHVDPVHLALQRDHFSLNRPVPLPLSRSHAETLIADLNRHFAANGLQFHLGRRQGPQGSRWYVCVPDVPDLRTCLPQEATGRDTRPYLPQGGDAQRWRGLINEVEMLLHEHPVNQAREAEGDLAVNSLWLSGGGVMPAALASAHDAVFADTPLPIGIAQSAHAPVYQVPQDMQVLLRHAGKAAILALDDAGQAEKHWFAPLMAALRHRDLQQVDLYFGLFERTLTVKVYWYDLYRFWRRPKPLSAYFSL